MELVFAFLTTAAEQAIGGSLHLFGADFDTVGASSFPLHMPPFTLVAKFRFSPEEVSVDHKLSVFLDEPNGETVSIVEPTKINLTLNGNDPTRPAAGTVLLKIGMKFETPGEYRFNIKVDGVAVTTLPLVLQQSDEPSS